MIEIFWRLLLGALPLSVDGGQLSDEFVKERLCSYYVAISTAEIEYKHCRRLLRYHRQHARQEIPHPSNAIYHLWGYDIGYVYLNFRPEKLPRRFLQYDVFLVYGMTLYGHPYKLGIDDEFNIVKFYGFKEESHRSPGLPDFKSYNDVIQFTRSEVPLEDNAEFRDFVYDWIQLTRFSDRPDFFIMTSNEFTLEDDGISGRCHTVQLDQGHYQESKVVYKEWLYKIPSSGQPELKLVSQEIVDENGTVWKGLKDEYKSVE